MASSLNGAIVYQDTFDAQDGIGTNAGIGGGLVSGTNITAADPFDDATGDAVPQTDFGNRVAWAHTSNQFNLSGGFTLTVAFQTAATGNPSFTSSFGIVDEVTATAPAANGTGPAGNLNAFLVSNQDSLNALGFSTTTRNDIQGINADFGTLSSVSTDLNGAIVLGTAQTFTLTVETDGSAAFDLDGTSGSVPAGTLSSLFDDSGDGSYYFAAYSQGNAGFTLNSVTIESIPEPSSIVLLGLSGLALLRRRR